MFPQLHTGVCVETDRELRTGGAFPTGRLHMAELRSSGELLSAKPDRRSPLSTVLTISLVLIPTAILVWMALHLSSKTLLIGAIAQVLGTALVLRSSSVWKPATSALMTGLFLMALAWLWYATHDLTDPLPRIARGLLLFISLILFLCHDLLETGLEPRRRSQLLIRQLKSTTRWPSTVEEFHYIPLVRKLYRIVRLDPTLAFPLLDDPRSEVQLAALSALQNRKHWRWPEAAYVLNIATKTSRPEVRAMVYQTLRSSNLRDIVTPIAEALRDPHPVVRTTACDVILSGGDARWALVRNEVRLSLIDPKIKGDGPMLGAAGKLNALAVCDLTAWSNEPAVLAERCVSTLLAHYRERFKTTDKLELVEELGQFVTNPESPAILRIEFSLLLRELDLLTVDMHDRMTDPNQPSPVRLIAVESMLACDPKDSTAYHVLRGLGRQSNCETALAVARILQRYCGLQFGVPDSAASPKQVQEALKKVQRWASGQHQMADIVETPLPKGVADGKPREALALFDEDDALGGTPMSMYPASIPGMSATSLDD